MRTRSIALFIVVGVASLLAGRAGAQPLDDGTMGIDGGEFRIRVPEYFAIVESPPAGIALQMKSPPARDARGLDWEMAVVVRVAPNANPVGRTIDQTVAPIKEQMRARLGADLLDGPKVESVNIPGSDGARLVTFRQRESGKHVNYYNLYALRGKDLFLVVGFVSARAGSEVLAKDFSAATKIRKAVTSFELSAPAATQPATTQSAPATQPATPPKQ